ncbi:deiodinase family protein [Paludisphaera mucosa]|uniref:Deiodinase family protein n=1 Tax=Paludisphaera mucosa TaxID=3030827 RepID=A0ABT6F9G4_9BACT|nr:deiodinase family protein [Paludisphaera mucosa]MDG3004121.1 deiodinase family protein [Paludisphaera mucosa]
MIARTSIRLVAVAAGLGLGLPATAEEPSKPQAATLATAPISGDEAGKALREAWPDRPEWLDMYTAILADEPMGPTNGWFRTSATQTRYGWDAVRTKYDRDGDGKVARKEYPGDDASFARLDRDRDSALAEPDFDFSRAYMPSPGSMLFSRLDRDGDGKVVREEVEKFFKAADGDDAGFLSRLDLERALPAPSGSMGPGDRPTKAQLIKGLFSQEIGSLQSGPKLDESAPDFTLKRADGQGELTLSKLIGPKPVVLIFGNFTCGPFRSMAGNFEKLNRRYGDRATFVMVYVREAHPSDGWRMQSNDSVGVTTTQPKTYEERAEVAQRCGKLLSLGFPMLVDTIDDAVGARYSGMPGRFYLLDKSGKIAFKNARGPFGFKPAELEQSLILLLQDEGSTSDHQARAEAR